LHGSTIRTALDLAAGASVAAPIGALFEGVVKSMTMTKVYVAEIGIFPLLLAAAGTLVIAATIVHDNPPPVAAPEPLPTPATLRRALKTWWDGIEMLEFREVESTVDEQGRPVESGRRAIVEVALGRGDGRAVMRGSLEPDGHVRVAQEKRDNGQTQIYLMSNPETPGKITDVRLTKQSNTRDA
jgi:hypothetical protein